MATDKGKDTGKDEVWVVSGQPWRAVQHRADQKHS